MHAWLNSKYKQLKLVLKEAYQMPSAKVDEEVRECELLVKTLYEEHVNRFRTDARTRDYLKSFVAKKVVQSSANSVTYLGKLNADPTGDKALLTITKPHLAAENLSKVLFEE